jgi:hypothetical protein
MSGIRGRHRPRRCQLEASRSDQLLDLVATAVVVGDVEQNRWFGCPVAQGLEEIGRHGAKRHG